jgi:hypothetical protein
MQVKRDIFGISVCPVVAQCSRDADGECRCYPGTTPSQRLSSSEAFLQRLQSAQDASGRVILDFSTVRQLPNGSFFVGPTCDQNGSSCPPGQKGSFLDKIEWIKVKLDAPVIGTNTSINGGSLTYSGTNYVRTEQMGTVPDSSRPDLRVGEMNVFASRYWQYVLGQGWVGHEGQSASISMLVTENEDVPSDTFLIHDFSERSVAASGWTLVIPTKNAQGQPILNLNNLAEIYLYFYHYSVTRQ